MAINFPSSPTDGQKFTSGTTVYTYSSSKGVWTGAPLGTALPFNYIINSGFQISQQNGDTVGLTPPYYMADLWSYQANEPLPVSAQRVPVTESASRYGLEFQAVDSSTPAAGDYQMLDHRIEGSRAAPFKWGTASAEQVVLRFSYFGLNVTGHQYAVAIRNAAGNRSYVIPFTMASSGQITTSTFVIPGETTGTWAKDNTMGISLDWLFHCGTTYYAPATLTWQSGNYLGFSGISNMINTAGTNYVRIFNVGLYLDPLKTGKAPPYELPPFRQNYSECQRYWQKQLGSIGVGIASTATPQRSAYPNQAFMRIVPTGTLVGTPRGWDQATAPNITAIANNYANQYVFEHNFTAASAMTAGRATAVIDLTPSLYIAQNARLI